MMVVSSGNHRLMEDLDVDVVVVVVLRHGPHLPALVACGLAKIAHSIA